MYQIQNQTFRALISVIVFCAFTNMAPALAGQIKRSTGRVTGTPTTPRRPTETRVVTPAALKSSGDNAASKDTLPVPNHPGTSLRASRTRTTTLKNGLAYYVKFLQHGLLTGTKTHNPTTSKRSRTFLQARRQLQRDKERLESRRRKFLDLTSQKGSAKAGSSRFLPASAAHSPKDRIKL